MTNSISPLSYLQTPTAHAASSSSKSGASQSNSQNSGMNSLNGVSANEGTFLTLLVNQLKNQDPLQPTDGTQFVSELAQFSSLEQLITINKNVGAIATNTTPAGGSSGQTMTPVSGSGNNT